METTSPWELVYFFAVLIGIVLLAYFVSKWLSRRFSSGQAQSTKYMKVVDKLILGQDKTLFIVRVGEKPLLLGVSQNGIEKICDIAIEDLPVITSSQPPSFKDALKSTLKNNWGLNVSPKSPDGEGKKDIDDQ